MKSHNMTEKSKDKPKIRGEKPLDLNINFMMKNFQHNQFNTIRSILRWI